MFGKNVTLKSKVLLVVSSIILIITFVGILACYNLFYNNNLESAINSQQRVAVFLSDIVEEHLIAETRALKTFVDTTVFDMGDSTLPDRLERYMKINNLLSIIVGFEDGTRVVNTSTTVAANYDHKIRPWYQNAITSMDAIVTPPYIDAFTGNIIISMTYPVINTYGSKGVICIDFSLNVDSYLEELPNKSLDGKMYVIDSRTYTVSAALDGNILMKHISELFGTDITKTIQSAVSGNVGKATTSYINTTEEILLGTITKVPRYDFIVLYSTSNTKIKDDIKHIAFQITMIMLGISLVGIIILYVMLVKILNPLGVYAKYIYDMAQTKDLSVRLDIKSNDELGAILKAVNMLNESTNSVVSEVKNSVIELASANNELAATMEELSATFKSQSEQVSDIVGGMDNISEISKTTNETLGVNMTSLENTANGTNAETEKLSDVSREMKDIEKDTVSLAETIKNLSESSAEIGNILNVINDIANQTNLLALNAAIEAARAGEAGRGFAVVADEVRKLAERTQSATKEIETIITGLQQESEKASQAMDKSITSVQEGSNNIQNVTGEIQKAVEQVTMLATGMRPVTDAVANQYTLIKLVLDNTREISSGIDESTSAVGEVNNTVNHLQRRTEYLKSLIEQFKI